MAIWPFIISRLDNSELGSSVVNHEKIHFRQQLEMLIIPFFLWYGLEYMYHLIRLRNMQEAYLAISLEKEAYSHEQEIEYLKLRKWLAWTRYL
jgi:hypothetical protein